MLHKMVFSVRPCDLFLVKVSLVVFHSGMSLKAVYLMRDPETRAVRYVGLTGRSLKQRLNGHIARRFRSDATAGWMRGLMERGLRPLMEVVEEVSELHAECEEKWIYHYRTVGEPLLNRVSLREAVYVAAPGTCLEQSASEVERVLQQFPGVKVHLGSVVTPKRDEAVQDDAPEDASQQGSRRRPRPRGGDREAQAARYHLRTRVRRRDYWKRYQAARRKAAKESLQAGLL